MTRSIKHALAFVACILACGTLTPTAHADAPIDTTPRSIIGDCEFQLDKPHNSHHNPGHVNSAARIKCNTAKKYLGVEVRITAWQGSFNPFFEGKYKNDSGTARTASAAATTDHCNYAAYSAEAWYLVIDHNDVRTEEYLGFNKIPVTC